ACVLSLDGRQPIKVDIHLDRNRQRHYQQWQLAERQYCPGDWNAAAAGARTNLAGGAQDGAEARQASDSHGRERGGRDEAHLAYYREHGPFPPQIAAFLHGWRPDMEL